MKPNQNIASIGQVVPDVLEDHVAFIFWGKPRQEACTFKVSGTACPTTQCHISEDLNPPDRMLL